jgi:hypothetical protein
MSRAVKLGARADLVEEDGQRANRLVRTVRVTHLATLARLLEFCVQGMRSFLTQTSAAAEAFSLGTRIT